MWIHAGGILKKRERGETLENRQKTFYGTTLLRQLFGRLVYECEVCVIAQGGTGNCLFGYGSLLGSLRLSLSLDSPNDSVRQPRAALCQTVFSSLIDLFVWIPSDGFLTSFFVLLV